MREGRDDLVSHGVPEENRLRLLGAQDGVHAGLGVPARPGDASARRLVDTGEAAKQRRLSRAVATHHGEDLAPGELQVDGAKHPPAAVSGGELCARRSGRLRPAARAREVWDAGRFEVAGEPACVAHRQRDGRPSMARPSWATGGPISRRANASTGVPALTRPPSHARTRSTKPATRSSRCSSDQHGHAMVVDEPLQRGEDVLRALWIQLARRLVEHEDPRPRRERRPIATRWRSPPETSGRFGS